MSEVLSWPFLFLVDAIVVLKKKKKKKKNTYFIAFIYWGGSKSDTDANRQRETDCTDKKNGEEENYCNIICWKSQCGNYSVENMQNLKQTLMGCMLRLHPSGIFSRVQFYP